MKFLIRTASPAVLSEYDYKTQKWDDVPTKDKDKIWVKLDQMQGGRCAYCQAKVKKGERHIEHFKQKRENQSLTFEWTNLFGSCIRKDGCGFYKDRQEYIESDLIKFDEDDPEVYFEFDINGRIKIRSGLSIIDERKARETLRILNLDPPQSPLIYNRSCAIKAQSYLSEAMLQAMLLFINDEQIEDCSDFLNEILAEHLELIKDYPFETAIKHHFISRFNNILNIDGLS